MKLHLHHRYLCVAYCAVILLFVTASGYAQASFTAQLRGVVTDPSGAAVPRAVVTITNEGTGVSSSTKSDSAGRYIFNALQPASYSISVEAPGFRKLVQNGIVLRVSQASVLNLPLQVGSVSTSVQVKGSAVLLNTANATLGQEVSSHYVTEIPLFDRQIEKLAYLTPGVTESQGFQVDQTNENFVSNGQRNSSAEIRLDGSILSVPEAGEGAMFWSHYQPSLEIVQQFKVETNGFSAQYGGNGGTVVNIVTKSGTNQLHGSGYWAGQWSALNANDFFSNRAGQPVPSYDRQQFGGTIGGPIIKDKLFYFGNYDHTIYNAPYTLTTTVPTQLQKQGDFSQTFNADGSLNVIYDPNTAVASGGDVVRTAFPGNVIPSSEIDPVAAKILQFYPNPTGAGTQYTGYDNFSRNYLLGQPAHQYNAKVDYNINPRNRLSARVSKGYLRRESPPDFLGNIGQGDEKNDYYNNELEYTFVPTPTMVWTTRVSNDYHHQTRLPDQKIDPTTVGFPSILVTANGSETFPELDVQNYQSLGLSGWTETIEAQNQWVVDSWVAKVIGGHDLQFGGESRTLLSNFFQPGHPSGQFGFGTAQTMESVFNPNSDQGNGFASFLTGWGSGGDLSIHPSVAELSRYTAFFVQDDWKVSRRLTLNLGLRYGFSTPYNDRYNRLQIANFTADTGVNVPGIGEIRGVDEFVTPGNRHAGSDWNNFGPRLGIAYEPFGNKTVIRAGAGVYYGISPATSYQDLGPAFRKEMPWQTTQDNYLTRFATMANPFPYGNVKAQGTQYGKLNMWGYSSTSNQSETFRNPEIYQWSFAVQHALSGSQTVEVAYSANRSTHLPIDGLRSRNYVSTANRLKYGSTGLYQYVPNPFYSMFAGPNATFNEPDSVYAQPTTQLINLLRQYPQFPGSYEGFEFFVANSWYNALQIKYEKHYSHGLNLIASYTLAKGIDDSSATSNGWLGNATSIQDPNNIRGEYSASATDARNRFVLAGSYDLPFGRGRHFGSNINPVLDGFAGGWQVNAFLTFQSGYPLNVYMANGRLADGSQRPNITGNARSSNSIHQVVDCNGACNYFNVSAFSDPGDQVAGNSPRFNGALRGDGIRDLDFSLFKNFKIHERYNVQLRAEFFNFTNTPRFTDPNTGYGNSSFGLISGQGNSPRQAQMGVRFTF